MSYVVNDHLNNLYVLSNKAVGPGKKSKINKRRAYLRLFQRLEYSPYFFLPRRKGQYDKKSVW